MSIEVDHHLKLTRKHASTFASSNASQDQSLMQEKLALLESQYVQMQVEYTKKIKELKATLAQKSRKQANLIGEITNLRLDFKSHQEQITQVSEKLTQELKDESLKMTKKNSSPGLIKKSIDYDKKHSSNNTNTSNKYGLRIVGQVKKPQFNQNSSPGIKRRSPRGNPNGLLHFLKQEPINQNPVLQKHSSGQEHHSGKKYIQPTSGDKKKAYSPKNSQQVKPTNVASVKNIKKAQPVTQSTSNGSPKRPIRRSPGLNNQKVVPKVEPKKQVKQLLGKLKQTEVDIQQAF